MLDGLELCRVLSLTNDLVELQGKHPGVLHLFERSACVHALMLGGVSDDENPVLGPISSRNARICFVLARLDSSSI